MDILNKICMGFAFVLGALFIVRGVLGLFAGCNAHFSLPPVLGVLPAVVGWGIVYAIRRAWNAGYEAAQGSERDYGYVEERGYQDSRLGYGPRR